MIFYTLYFLFIGTIIIFSVIPSEKKEIWDQSFRQWLLSLPRGSSLEQVYSLTKRYIRLGLYFVLQTIVTVISFLMDMLNRYIFKKPINRLILWGIFFYLAHFNVGKGGGFFVSFLKNFYLKWGFDNASDKTTLLILEGLLAGLIVFLPLSLTLYIFTYREQKTMSESASNMTTGKIPLILFIEFSLFTIIYGKLLSFLIGQDPRFETGTLILTSEYTIKLCLWTLFYLCSLGFGIKTVLELLRNINISALLNSTINKTSQEFIKLPLIMPYSGFKKLRKRTFDILCNNIESIYQMLSLTIDKNMDSLFHEYYAKWEKVFLNFRDRLIFIRDDSSNVTIYYMPINTDRENFLKFYRSIIKNHLSLIATLFKKHKLGEVSKCIDTLFQMNPRENEMYPTYLDGLRELAIYIYENDSNSLRYFLRKLELLSKELNDNDKTGIILIYKELIVRASNENSTQLLSNLCYSMTLIYKELKPSNQRVSSMLQSFHEEPVERVQKACIFIMLQAALKCIELPHYASVGFLMKFMVSNLNPTVLREVVESFVMMRAQNNPYLIDFENYRALNSSFNFNQVTIDYCMKKLIILLSGQQLYVMKNKIDFGYVPDHVINLRSLSCNYLDYLFSKIEKAKSKYGLMYLDDNMFMKEFKLEVYFQTRKLEEEQLEKSIVENEKKVAYVG
ncbi:hypothetical protein [Brevibacillus sp. NL20B1]|uniref:hypothetical protein n=1 Tax=Brevibacillus sp. NL20B1 TaxID=2829799 RepID=UPI001B9BCECE|nr:hypothetical protein [Brevibacillus sp. NL20B1]MBR8660701.1 hypothetical protein [Brevibacillus sp. NL20B1]